MYIYFKHIKKMYQCGPYGPNHATAGTFAFKVRLLDDTKYEDHAALAEEKAFLKNYTVPFVQLDPLKTILVFSHIHNTFDKKKLLENPHPDYFKESAKTVSDFIRRPEEAKIHKFFMEDIERILEKYEPGEPKMKPDVLEQTKIIEENRQKMIAEAQQQQNANVPGIMVQEPGKPPRMLSPEETLHIINNQQQDIQMLTTRNKELEEMVVELQKQLLRLGGGTEKSEPKTNNLTPCRINDAQSAASDLRDSLRCASEISPANPAFFAHSSPEGGVLNEKRCKSEPDITISI
jgi:hypothetical protein